MANNTCSYAGPRAKIPDVILGAQKKVTAEAEVTRKGKKTTEKLQNSKWHIRGKGLRIVKDYEVSLDKGKYEELSDKDYKLNPLQFKIWKSEQEKVSVRCEGKSSVGSMNIQGEMGVKSPVSGKYKSFEFEPLAAIQEGADKSWEFWTSLEFELPLDIKSDMNGEIGVIHLADSIRRSENGNQKIDIFNTEGKYFLYPHYKKGGKKEPVAHKVSVANGKISSGDNSSYKILIPVIQKLKPEEKRYVFKEFFQTYLVYKPKEKAKDEKNIWVPMKISNPEEKIDGLYGFVWGYEAIIEYDPHTKKFFFEYANRFKPEMREIHNLPVWNGHLNHEANF